MKKLSGIVSGITGVYLVAAELSKHGYIVTTTMRNAQGVDILVSNTNATKTLAIQVKSNQGHHRSWVLNAKAEKQKAKDLFYVFVNLNGGEKPDFFIVPAKVVAEFAAQNHKQWRETPGKKGQEHKDNSMRKFYDKELEFLDRWDLLGLD